MYSKWSISSAGIMVHEKRDLFLQPFEILYLDDHTLFSSAVKDILQPFFPRAKINLQQNGDQVLRLLQQLKKDTQKPALLITDINHPGLAGHLLLKALRSIENEKGYCRMPAMVLSMVAPENLPEFSDPAKRLADYWFTKDIDPELLVEALKLCLAISGNPYHFTYFGSTSREETLFSKGYQPQMLTNYTISFTNY